MQEASYKMRNAVGRPTVLSDNTVSKLIVLLASGLSVSAACYQSGISREAYYSGLRNNPHFTYKIAHILDDTISSSRVLIVARIAQGDVSAAKWWLSHKRPSEFK